LRVYSHKHCFPGFGAYNFPPNLLFRQLIYNTSEAFYDHRCVFTMEQWPTRSFWGCLASSVQRKRSDEREGLGWLCFFLCEDPREQLQPTKPCLGWLRASTGEHALISVYVAWECGRYIVHMCCVAYRDPPLLPSTLTPCVMHGLVVAR